MRRTGVWESGSRVDGTLRPLLFGAAALAGVVTLCVALPLGQAASAASHKSTAPTVKVVTRGSLGSILVTGSGYTLYRYTPDKANDPTCTGSCASAWPPLLVSGGTKSPKGPAGLSSVKVTGGRQVTYHGIPLYRYAMDTSPSDTLGQGVEGTWYVVHPTATATTAAHSGGVGHGSTSTTSSGGYGY